MKKFAIYKGETGFRYHRYIERLDELEGDRLFGIITEDKLPVVLDDRGGYFRFDGNDYNFSEIIETDKDCPLSLEKMYFRNDDKFKLGWISPEGDTYSCDYTSHTKCAKVIAEKFFPETSLPERTLGKAGWLKVIDSWNGTQREHGQFVYSLSGKITKKQADRLFDLGLYDNAEVRELLKNCENDW